MMTSHVLKFVDFTKTQKSIYLENETLFFLPIKKLITHQGLLYGKKYFCSGGKPLKKGVLKNFAKFTGKHLCHSLFFNKVAGLSLNLFFNKVF